MKKLCYLDGKIIPVEQARLPLPERGFLYGDGIFETMSLYHGKLFLPDRHLNRLRAGAAFLGIKKPGEKEFLAKELNRFLAAIAPVKGFPARGSLRLTLTRGRALTGLWPGEDSSQNPTIFITATDSIPYTPEQYEQGFRVIYISFPCNELSPLTGYKTLNYLENILGRREVSAKGAGEGIFLNRQGHLAEGTVSNLFIVRDGVLLTPPLSAGLLPGITREVVLEIARADGICTEEQNLYPRDLETAAEAFLTNSLMGIMPLTKAEGKIIGNGLPGPLTKKLATLYSSKCPVTL